MLLPLFGIAALLALAIGLSGHGSSTKTTKTAPTTPVSMSDLDANLPPPMVPYVLQAASSGQDQAALEQLASQLTAATYLKSAAAVNARLSYLRSLGVDVRAAA